MVSARFELCRERILRFHLFVLHWTKRHAWSYNQLETRDVQCDLIDREWEAAFSHAFYRDVPAMLARLPSLRRPRKRNHRSSLYLKIPPPSFPRNPKQANVFFRFARQKSHLPGFLAPRMEPVFGRSFLW